MVLVDPSQMLLKTSPVPDPISNSVLVIDDDIKRILEQTDISDHDKANEYQQALNRYLNRISQYNIRDPKKATMNNNTLHNNTESNSKPFEVQADKIEARIIESVPPTLQKKAKLLLDHIKDSSDITWNKRGELIAQGQTLENSNVSDLIHETLRQRKKLGDEPSGWSTFANELRQSNVPQELIGNKTRWNKHKVAFVKDSPLFTTPTQSPFSTPRRPQSRRLKQQSGQPWLDY